MQYQLKNQNNMTNEQITTAVASLTKSQFETYTILVRLGDSKELALKTILEQKEISASNSKMYQQAYYS
jgi:NADH:ubiquinone oxidoreductase subunit C